MPEEREYWDLELKNGGARLSANTFQALIAFDGQLHDSSLMGPGTERKKFWIMPKWWHVYLRISLPKGVREDFETTTGLKLIDPPKVNGA